jgi:Ca2+/H+ antiporter
MDPKKIQPFELRTTAFTQLMIFLWVPLLLMLPEFVSPQVRILSYLVSILVMMIVFLSFFLATQRSMKKDENERH